MFHVQYIFIFLAFATLTVAQQDSVDNNSKEIPPLFEGCNDPLISDAQREACSSPKIKAFLAQNIIYPDSAKNNNIEGVVVISFVVSDSGIVRDIEIVRDIGYGCGNEAVRVVSMMPRFSPALKSGIPVSKKMTIPIRFKKIDEARADNKNLYQLHWGNIYGEVVSRNKIINSLNEEIVVRDYYGNLFDVLSFEIRIVSGRSVKILESANNKMTLKMKRILRAVNSNTKVHFKAEFRKENINLNVSRILKVIN